MKNLNFDMDLIEYNFVKRCKDRYNLTWRELLITLVIYDLHRNMDNITAADVSFYRGHVTVEEELE